MSVGSCSSCSQCHDVFHFHFHSPVWMLLTYQHFCVGHQRSTQRWYSWLSFNLKLASKLCCRRFTSSISSSSEGRVGSLSPSPPSHEQSFSIARFPIGRVGPTVPGGPSKHSKPSYAIINSINYIRPGRSTAPHSRAGQRRAEQRRAPQSKAEESSAAQSRAEPRRSYNI